MRNFTIYLTGFLCLFLTKVFAQDTFESRAKVIAAKIETITKDEKAALKAEVETVNGQLESGALTKEQAETKKEQLAETHAKNIENRVNEVQGELKALVQEKVDGKIKEQDSTHKFMLSYDAKKDKHKKGQSRSVSEFTFAVGSNNLVTNNAVAHSDYKYLGSHFYELGMSYNTRILKNNNLLHAKYGVSFMFNNLRPTDDRFFVEAGNQTVLVKSPIDITDSRFRNTYVVVPVHLEFDFSGKENKDDKTIFRTHQSFRVGLGGYVGGNLRTKQILKYRDGDDHRVKDGTIGDYNVNDLIYGVSAYVGYQDVSLYFKYDLSPLFRNNLVDQNNISFGLRWDWN